MSMYCYLNESIKLIRKTIFLINKLSSPYSDFFNLTDMLIYIHIYLPFLSRPCIHQTQPSQIEHPWSGCACSSRSAERKENNSSGPHKMG